MRKKADADDQIATIAPNELSYKQFAQNWACLIKKIYEVDTVGMPQKPGDFMTCTAMSINGVRTGMATIPPVVLPIPRGPRQALTVWCAVAPGGTPPILIVLLARGQ